MTRKKLFSFIEFLKLTDTEKDVTIHNRKKSHTEVAEQLGLSFDTTIKCLGYLLCIALALVVLWLSK